VTGAASRLGGEVARRIVAEGGTVVLWDVDADRLTATAADIGATHYAACDVADLAAVERATAASVAALGKIDMLICSAGITGATASVPD